MSQTLIGTTSTKNIVCDFSADTARIWMEGPMDYSPTFGDHLIILTSLYKTAEITEKGDMIHVDNLRGEIKIVIDKSSINGKTPTVSCHYENEKINN